MREKDLNIALRKLKLRKALNSIRGKKFKNARINYEHKLIFIHIPKTAGNSITKNLKSLGDKDAYNSPKISKHAKAFEVKELLGKKVWDDYFSFTFVRNPWDLMVSSYHWWLQKAPGIKYHRKQAEEVKSLGSFDAFLGSDFGKYMINERYGDMSDWYSGTENNIIIDHIGKVETINDDWKKICYLNDLEYEPIPHINASKRKNYREYYNDQTRIIVENRFKRTIEKFGYEF